MHRFRFSVRTIGSILCGPLAAAIVLTGLPPPAHARPSFQFALAGRIVAPLASRDRHPHHTRGRPKRDSDGDGLPDWIERWRTRTDPRRRDTDRDRLSDWTEVKRTRTNPRRRDTDRDGLSDWAELRRTHTNPRRADSDGDGVRDGEEVLAGSDPRDPASLPDTPHQPSPPAPGPTPSPPPTEGSGEEGAEPPAPTPPDTTIDGHPSSLTNSAAADFAFSGSGSSSGVAYFQCRLDSSHPAGWEICASPAHYTGLSDGPHSFEVRAIDLADNADESAASFTWTVDTTPPSVEVLSGPDGLTNDPTPTFGFGAEAGASLECSIDEGTPASAPAREKAPTVPRNRSPTAPTPSVCGPSTRPGTRRRRRVTSRSTPPLRTRLF